jgi:RNA polymerase sigma factor (sigma-70 family)
MNSNSPSAVRDSSETTQLLRAVLTEDEHGWRSFYERYDPFIRTVVARTMQRYCGIIDGETLADHVSEVWVALLKDNRRKLRRYDPTLCRLTTWLRLLATNATIDGLRQRRHDVAAERLEDDERTGLDLRQDPDVDPESALRRRERVEVARRALTELRLADRAFVEHFLNAGHGTEELATALGISANTLRSRRSKIAKKLSRHARRIESRPAPCGTVSVLRAVLASGQLVPAA